jgi:hypothetical protein
MAWNNGRFHFSKTPRDETGGGKELLMLAIGAVIGALVGRTRSRKRISKSAEPLAKMQTTDRTPEREPLGVIPQAGEWSEIPAHEKSDANLPALGATLVVLALSAFVIHAALWWWVKSPGPATIDETTRWNAIAQRVPEPSREFPQLQISPQRDLEDFLARQEQGLRGESATSGVARIPIERAMELVIQNASREGRTKNGRGPSPLELQQRRASEATK